MANWNPSLPNPRKCKICSTVFQPNNIRASHQVYCSDECKKIGNSQTQRRCQRRKKGVIKIMAGQKWFCPECKRWYRPNSGNQEMCKSCRLEIGYPSKRINKHQKYRGLEQGFRQPIKTPHKMCTRCNVRPVGKGLYFLCDFCYSGRADREGFGFNEDCLYMEGSENGFDDIPKTDFEYPESYENQKF